MTQEKQDKRSERSPGRARIKTVAIAIIPLIVLSGIIAFLFGPGQAILNIGVPLPEVTIQRIEFQQGKIVALIQNTGPTEVAIAQVDVNDRIFPAAIEPSSNLARLGEAKVIIPYAWSVGEPYEIGITTSDGVRFSKSIEAAAPAPIPNVEQASFFALIGTYVGVIPVLVGLLWFPFLSRLSLNKYNFFLSLTAGLLVFLGLDALIEGNEVATNSIARVFNGPLLIAIITILSFLALQFASSKLVQRAQLRVENIAASSTATPYTTQRIGTAAIISMMVAIGIGIHNFGEGLAIGAAMLLGNVALSTFLIVGFTLHNTTEGLAIVAPMAKSGRIAIRKLVLMGLVAGVPTIAGTWIGGFLYSPVASIIFLSIGAGAIFQVVYAIYSWMAQKRGSDSAGLASKNLLSDPSILLGFAAGLAIMYITALLVPS